MAEIVPVQRIGFDSGTNFEGRIIDELGRFESERTIRDLANAYKQSFAPIDSG